MSSGKAIGAEKVIELDWCEASNMAGLIFHELGHIWHKDFGLFYQQVSTVREKSVLQLYQEGIAMYFEQLMSKDLCNYHQNKSKWLIWCTENKKRINREYFRRLNNNESTQDFFGDWNNYQGCSDVGFSLKCLS